MGKTSTKTQTTTPANPAVTSAYSDLIGRANSLSQNGNPVAGLTPDQLAAISGISQNTTSAQPWLNEAAGFARQSAAPVTPMQFSPDAVQQYMDPYIQSVINATQNQFNQTNAAQQASLRGNAAASGALGGDREAVLQAELAGSQARNQAPVIAGLYSSGFGQALNQFNTQQGVDLGAQQANRANAAGAGTSIGNLGLAGQNAALGGFGALLGAGGLEQQTNQLSANAPYYNLDFLSQILGGAATGSGTTTTSKATTPFNPFSLIGLGSPYGSKDGGRTRLAFGGMPDGAGTGFYVPLTQGHGLMGTGDGATAPSYRGPSRNLFDDGKEGGSGGGGFDLIKTAGGFAKLLGLAMGGRSRLADGGMDFDGLDFDPSEIAPAQPTEADNTPPSWLAADAAPSNDNAPATTGEAPVAPPPAWDDGTPLFGGATADTAGGFAPQGKPRVIWQAPEDPDIWHSVLAGLGGFLSKGTIGAGIQAGQADYDAQLDPHPTIDHSGSSIMIQYGGPGRRGQIIDTGIPTEAALNARAMADYRKGELGVRQTAIDAANARAAEALAERNRAAKEVETEREWKDYQSALDNFNKMRLQLGEEPVTSLPGRAPPTAPGQVVAPSPSGGIAGANLANNNPGNMRIPGQTAFQSFPTMQAGIDAVGNQIARYVSRGTNTISSIVSTYAPKADHNDTAAYIRNVAALTGLDPDRPIARTDIPKVRDAMITTEQGGVTPQQLLAAPPAPAPTAEAPINTNLHGEAFLRTVDPNTAAQVRAVLQGREPFPAGFSWRSPVGQRLMRLARQADPNFDATLFDARKKAQTELSNTTPGHMGANIQSFNTAIGHAARLDQAIDRLGNFTYAPGVLNPIKGFVEGNTNPDYQRARAAFETDRQALVDELTRAFRGTGGNVHDLADWEAKLSVANSPAALHTAVQEGMHLLKSRIDAVEEQYRRGTRTTIQPGSFLSGPARKAFEQLIGEGDATGATASGIPQRPSSVPSGSQYSPSRRMWRDPSGNLYDGAGNPVKKAA